MVRCEYLFWCDPRPLLAVVDLTLKIMAGDESGLRQRPLSGNPNLTVAKVYTPTVEGQKRDEMLDKHTECVPPPHHTPPFVLTCILPFRYEFGGPWGVFAIMTGFPILMYYLWICLVFYDGSLVHPASVDDIQPFLWRMWDHIRVVRLTSLFILFLFMTLYSHSRMQAPTPTRGGSTSVSWSSSSLSLGSSLVSCKKAFPSPPSATRPSCISATPSAASTLP